MCDSKKAYQPGLSSGFLLFELHQFRVDSVKWDGMEIKNAVTSIDMAFEAHSVWKTKLLADVKSGEVLDAAKIKRDDCCGLGTWIYSDGKRQYGHKPEFTTLLEKHKDFHIITSIVVGIVNSKDPETSIDMIGRNSQFSSASMELGMAILRLKKAVAAESSEATDIPAD
jgi:aerotaxis receptor